MVFRKELKLFKKGKNFLKVGNYADGLYFITKSAKKGYAPAQLQLGVAYNKGEGIEENQNQAVHWWKLAAEQGEIIAQCLLGSAYFQGEGVQEDKEQAFYWWKLAAEQGELGAQTLLGIAYYEGEDVKVDKSQAFFWLKLAAEQEDTNVHVQLLLGIAYYEGDGVQKDIEQALHWIKLAAEQGETCVQSLLGLVYYQSKEVQKNTEQAVHWWKLAAEKGDDKSQFYLGLAYSNGEGVEKDLEQAVHWWKLAAEQGLVEAQDILKEINPNRAEIIPFPVSKIDKSSDEKKIQAAIETLKMLVPELQPDLKKVYLTKIKDIRGISDYYEENVFKRSIQSLINVNENLEIEFKETFSMPTKVGKDGQTIKTDVIRYAALQEITGFLNTNNGVLLIGIADSKNTDSKNPEIRGIESDNFNGDQDKYARIFHDIVKSALGETAASLVETSFEQIHDKTVFRVNCKKSSQPVYCNYKNYGKKPFVRYGTSTTEPPQEEWLRWVKEKFK